MDENERCFFELLAQQGQAQPCWGEVVSVPVGEATRALCAGHRDFFATGTYCAPSGPSRSKRRLLEEEELAAFDRELADAFRSPESAPSVPKRVLSGVLERMEDVEVLFGGDFVDYERVDGGFRVPARNERCSPVPNAGTPQDGPKVHVYFGAWSRKARLPSTEIPLEDLWGGAPLEHYWSVAYGWHAPWISPEQIQRPRLLTHA